MDNQTLVSPQLHLRPQPEKVDIQRRLLELTALYSVTKIATTAVSLDEIIESATRIVGETLYPHNFGICMWNQNRGVLEPHPSYRISHGNFPLQLKPGEGLVGSVLLTGGPIRVGDVRYDDRYRTADQATRSELCVPLWGKEHILGVINAESTDQGAFSEADERLLEALAAELTNSMEMMRLFQAEKRRRMESERLREAMTALTSTLDMNQVIERILVQLQEVVPYISITMMLVDNAHLEVLAVRGFRSPNQEKILLDIDRFQHLRDVLETARPMIIPDTYKDPRWQVRDDSQYIRCWLGVPLVIRDQVIGLLNLDYTEPGRYTEEDAELAMAFANQAAVAVENARLFNNLEQSHRELYKAYDATIEGWSRALELRDRETEGHT